RAAVGESVNVTVEVGNLGNYFTETFQVDVYASPSNISLESLIATGDARSAIIITPGVNVMWIEPRMLAFNPSSTPVGYRFNVTAYVSLNVPSFAWQIYLTYNKLHLIATGCWYSAGAQSEWAGTRPAYPVTPCYGSHNATHNYVLCGECLIGEYETPPGTYSLVIVEFEIVNAPPPGKTFESQIRLDVEGEFKSFMLDPDLNIIPLTFMGATYKYGEVMPPPPPPPPPPGAINIGTFTVSNLPPGGVDSRTITWNTFGVPADNYTIWALAQSLPGELSIEDNRFVDGSILLVSPPKANFTYSPTYPLPNETVVFDASHSSPNGGVIEFYVWDFGDGQTLTTSEPTATHTYLESGAYNVTLKVIDSEGLTGSCWGIVYVCFRDLSIVNVTVSTDRAYAGQKVAINVTVSNKGEGAESFGLWLYYDMEIGNLIEVRSVSLNPGETKILAFIWDTADVQPCRSYVVTAYVPPLLGERNLSDNKLECSTAVKIKMFGDVDGDGKVDMKDVAAVSRAFGSTYGLPGWNADADINGDFKVDLKDVAAVSKRFGSTCC
ncbi:MAG: PKD domain-containing protein, partial [Candidatus Bathyarchaeia archaeon]